MIVGLVIGAISGVLGNLIVGYLFYRRSGKELRVEAEQLRQETQRVRRMVNVLGRTLQEARVIEATWDEQGEIRGAVIHAPPMRGSLGSSGQLETKAIKGESAVATAGLTAQSEGHAATAEDE